MNTVLDILLLPAILVTVIIIIQNTSSTTKALAYIFLIILFPLVGMFIYYSLGINYRSNKIYSKKLEIDRQAFPELEVRLKEFSEQVIKANFDRLKHFYRLAQLKNLEYVLTIRNETKLLINGEEKFPDVIETLLGAKHHIHIEYYIYEKGEIGNRIAEVVKKKAQEGVQVRFIYDDFGSRGIRRDFVKALIESGIEAYPFYKLRWHLFASRINYRNHRKIIIVDGKVGYVGGINISDRYKNPNTYDNYWRDTHLRIEGTAVLSLQQIFLADWNFCSGQHIQVNSDYFPISDFSVDIFDQQIVQVVASGPDSDHPDIMYSMIQAIILAKEEIFITTPYFVPDEEFMGALKIARLSGVTIKLLVPGVSDSRIVNAVSNSYYGELLEIGVEVYKYHKGFVHAKTMVADTHLSVIGTANLDQRSFDLNFEINALVFDGNLAKQLRSTFLNDLEASKKLEYESWKKRPYLTRLLERSLRMLAPLI